jgi:hypothetical protein
MLDALEKIVESPVGDYEGDFGGGVFGAVQCYECLEVHNIALKVLKKAGIYK